MKAKVVTFVISVLVMLASLWALWYAVKGPQVAAGFTRVGGSTRLETAVEAARFWLTPPQRIVTTKAANKRKGIMWGAARCAVLHDAPLLFTSRNPKRQRLVEATIAAWGKKKTDETDVQSPKDVNRCLREAKPNQSRLSTLAVPDRPLLLPQLEPRAKLAPLVVFAAAKTPRDLPDIAVGLALAAHLAKGDGNVSFVAVPRITSTNRPGVLAEIRNSLGALGAAVAALVALLGLATAARLAPELAEEAVQRLAQPTEWRVVAMVRAITPQGKDRKKRPGPEPEPRELDFLKGLDGKITVWLRSGLRITGTLKSSDSEGEQADAPTGNVVELADATLGPEPQEDQAPSRMRVRVEDIELISVSNK